MGAIQVGDIVAGKYEVLKLLGSGGMGEVYVACHVQMPEFRVALKTLNASHTCKVENKEKFRNEVIAAYRVNHPNIVQMYEYFDLGELQAFAMEFVAGATLAAVMTEERLPADVSISFAKQIAMGLSALHRAGTYHRDLKPENVLVADDGRLKLTDFGVAHIRGGVSLEMEGVLVGTPHYVPPEYVENHVSDHRGDIYALGVMLYEMLAGVTPFTAPTRNSLLKERLVPHGLDLRERVPELPAALVAIVERCLAVSVTQRYPHAVDVAEDLARVQKEFSLSDTADCSQKTSETKVYWNVLLREREQEARAQSEKNGHSSQFDGGHVRAGVSRG
jgi:serine/threonine protein kinase